MKDTEQEDDVTITTWADEPIMVSALVVAMAVVGGS